jgi:uncharacterized protein YbbK (DUF523 family)
MPGIVTERMRLGVSACVYRCPVRYNGRAFDAVAVLGRERSDYVFTPVCPECLAGLGVPRDPIHLTGSGAEVLAGTAQVRDRRGHDVTARVVEGSRAAMDALERAGVQAVIVKESSPTCGLMKAQVGKRRQAETGAGVFGAQLLASGWFLIPDDALASPLRWWDARRRLHAWLWLKARRLDGAKDLYEAWHVLKFVVQEIDRPLADDIGRRLAALPRRPDGALVDASRVEIMDALRRPSTTPRIRQAMWKTYVHHRKHGRLAGVDLHDLDPASPEVVANTTRIVADLAKMERVSFENDLLFGTSPVLRRDARRVRMRDEELSRGGGEG